MSLHRKLFVTAGVPAAVAFALLYLSAVAPTRTDGQWLFRIGVTFLIAAGVFAWLTLVGHEQHRVRDWAETAVADIRRHQRDQDEQIETIEEHLRADLTYAAMGQAAGRLATQRHRRLRMADQDGEGA